MSRALRATLVGMLAAASLLQAGAMATAQQLRLAPDRPLAFTDADGRTVLSSDFHGKWLLVYFGYTHCADLCPTGLTAMVTALDQIGDAAAHIQPLSSPSIRSATRVRCCATSRNPSTYG